MLTPFTTRSLQVPSDMIEGRDCIDFCQLGSVSILSLSSQPRPPPPDLPPLLYPAHIIPDFTIVYSLISCLLTLLCFSRTIPRNDPHDPETPARPTRTISYDYLAILLYTIAVIEAYLCPHLGSRQRHRAPHQPANSAGAAIYPPLYTTPPTYPGALSRTRSLPATNPLNQVVHHHPGTHLKPSSLRSSRHPLPFSPPPISLLAHPTDPAMPSPGQHPPSYHPFSPFVPHLGINEPHLVVFSSYMSAPPPSSCSSSRLVNLYSLFA